MEVTEYLGRTVTSNLISLAASRQICTWVAEAGGMRESLEKSSTNTIAIYFVMC